MNTGSSEIFYNTLNNTLYLVDILVAAVVLLDLFYKSTI